MENPLDENSTSEPPIHSTPYPSDSAPAKLDLPAFLEYLSNPWIAGAVGGVASIIVFCIITFLLPPVVNLPVFGETLSYIMLLGAALPLLSLAVWAIEQQFADEPDYLSVAIPAVVSFVILGFLVQAIASPNLPTMYNGEPSNSIIIFIFLGFIPSFIFSALARSQRWKWFAILGVLAIFVTHLQMIMLGVVALFVLRMVMSWRSGTPMWDNQATIDKERDRDIRRNS